LRARSRARRRTSRRDPRVVIGVEPADDAIVLEGEASIATDPGYLKA
jgi:hypothetical protein